jgi:hypothetical protein
MAENAGTPSTGVTATALQAKLVQSLEATFVDLIDISGTFLCLRTAL